VLIFVFVLSLKKTQSVGAEPFLYIIWYKFLLINALKMDEKVF